jgi:succinate-semialdehyde dehydrogenase/glutarate-semialdehyde dehydrogenase
MEQGKTLRESRGEYERAVKAIDWNASKTTYFCAPKHLPTAGFERFVQPEPAGVVAAFVPWNYPAILSARKLAAAVGAGCSVILKGPEEAPSAPTAMVEALMRAGLPPGVVNLLFGHPPFISQRLLGSPIVRMLTFTGSTKVGRELAEIASRDVKRCVLEQQRLIALLAKKGHCEKASW